MVEVLRLFLNVRLFCDFLFSFSAVAMTGKVKGAAVQLWENVNRKKTITEDFHDTPLKKCLNTFDMTLLGIGQMIGAGIYVLTGRQNHKVK